MIVSVVTRKLVEMELNKKHSHKVRIVVIKIGIEGGQRTATGSRKGRGELIGDRVETKNMTVAIVGTEAGVGVEIRSKFKGI